MVNTDKMRPIVVVFIADDAVKPSLPSLSTSYTSFECVGFARGHLIHLVADKSGSRRATRICLSSNCQNDLPLKKYVFPNQPDQNTNER